MDEPAPRRILRTNEVTEMQRPRLRVVLAILILAAALLFAFTAYGMVNGDAGILGTVLTLVRDMVVAVLGWALGRYSSL